MTSYKVWLFDFDYTLVDSSEPAYICLNYALQKYGNPPVDKYTAVSCVGYTMTEVFYRLTGISDYEEAQVFRGYFKEKADQLGNHYTTFYPNVPEVLQQLRRKGVRLGIVSTKNRYRIENFLSEEDRLGDFDVIIGGEDVTEHKPSPEPLEKAARFFNYPREEIFYVGDSVVDAGAARAFEVDFGGVLTGTTSRKEFRPYKPVEIAPRLHEFSFLNVDKSIF